MDCHKNNVKERANMFIKSIYNLNTRIKSITKRKKIFFVKFN